MESHVIMGMIYDQGFVIWLSLVIFLSATTNNILVMIMMTSFKKQLGQIYAGTNIYKFLAQLTHPFLTHFQAIQSKLIQFP